MDPIDPVATCSNGHENPARAKFCVECGERFLELPRDTEPFSSQNELRAGVSDADSASGTTDFDLIPPAPTFSTTGERDTMRKRPPVRALALALICVLVVGGVVAVLTSRGSSSSSNQASIDTSSSNSVDTSTTVAPLTDQQRCAAALPQIWDQEFNGGKAYDLAMTDVAQQYGYQSAIYQAFSSIVMVAEQKQLDWGQSAAAQAAMDNVSTACTNALASYALDDTSTTTTLPYDPVGGGDGGA